MIKRVAVCAALSIFAMHGGSAFAGSDYPISEGGGGDPQCEAAVIPAGGGTTGAGGGQSDAGGDADGCWTPPADPGDPLPGDPTPGISVRNPSPQQSLPATGSDNGDLLRLGGVTVAAGLGLVVATRRRRQSAA